MASLRLVPSPPPRAPARAARRARRSAQGLRLAQPSCRRRHAQARFVTCGPTKEWEFPKLHVPLIRERCLPTLRWGRCGGRARGRSSAGGASRGAEHAATSRPTIARSTSRHPVLQQCGAQCPTSTRVCRRRSSITAEALVCAPASAASAHAREAIRRVFPTPYPRPFSPHTQVAPRPRGPRAVHVNGWRRWLVQALRQGFAEVHDLRVAASILPCRRQPMGADTRRPT